MKQNISYNNFFIVVAIIWKKILKWFCFKKINLELKILVSVKAHILLQLLKIKTSCLLLFK